MVNLSRICAKFVDRSNVHIIGLLQIHSMILTMKQDEPKPRVVVEIDNFLGMIVKEGPHKYFWR